MVAHGYGFNLEREGVTVSRWLATLDARAPLAAVGAGWSKEAPTVAGWFWLRRSPDSDKFPYIVRLRRGGYDSDGPLEVWFSGSECEDTLETVLLDYPLCEWSGPLAPPASGDGVGV
jgi:hypothetical protein